jgi:hypothetical protein
LIQAVPNALPKSAKVRKFITGHLPEKCFVRNVEKDLTMSFWLQFRMKKLTRVGIDEKGGEKPLFFLSASQKPK